MEPVVPFVPPNIAIEMMEGGNDSGTAAEDTPDLCDILQTKEEVIEDDDAISIDEDIKPVKIRRFIKIVPIKNTLPKKSGIWAHYKSYGPGAIFATCSHCDLDIKCGANQSTSSLYRHMRFKHASELREMTPDLVPIIKRAITKEAVDPNEAKKSKEDILSKEPEVSDPDDFEPAKITQRGLVRKPLPRKSEIWAHFKLNGTQATCFHCKFNMKCGANRSTSALFRHMRARHPSPAREIMPREVNRRMNKRKIIKISDSDGKEDSLVGTSVPLPDTLPQGRPPLNRLQTVNEKIIFMLASEYLPLDFVESFAFVEVINAANTRCRLPSKTALRETLIPEKCFTISREIQRLLHRVNAVCITTEKWTSRNSENYIALAAHWINPETLTRTSNLLSCTSYEGSDSPELLKNVIANELERWKVSDKVTCIVSDNNSDVRAAIELGHWNSVDCFASTLLAVAECATTEIGDILMKISTLVTFFQRSSVGGKKLKEVQKEHKLSNKKLLQSCKSRWKSVYKMLTRFYELRECITSTLQSLTIPDVPVMPTVEDWVVMEQACYHLRPIFEVIKEMEAENYVMISKVIPYVTILTETVQQTISGESFHAESEPIKNMLHTLNFELVAKFAHVESEELLVEATLLDPRFKEHAFQDPINAEVGITRLRRKLGMGKVRRPPIENHNKTNAVWERFEQKLRQLEPTKKSEPTKECMDLEKYLSEKYLDRRGNPLKWWLRKKANYPKLADVAIERLNIQAASVPCRDFFSRSGLIRKESRNCLKPDMLCELVFLNYNL